MKEKVILQKKNGKVYAYFLDKKHTMAKSSILEVKQDLEDGGYLVELKD